MKTRLLVPAVVAAATISIAGLPATAAFAAPEGSTFAAESQGGQGTVTEDGNAKDASDENAVVTIKNPKVTNADFKNKDKGAVVEVSGLTPNTIYELALEQVDPKGGGTSVEATATADGTLDYNFYGTSPGADYTGKYTVTVLDLDGKALGEPGKFEVTDETAPTETPKPSETPKPTPSETAKPTPSETPSETEAPEVDPELSIAPKKVSVTDFVNKNKGVKITVSGLEPGAKASIEVDPESKDVTEFKLTETANDKGVAQFSVYGTNASRASVYLGKYNVTVATDDATATSAQAARSAEALADLTDTFEVVAGDGSGGGNGNGNGGGNGGNELPRTGAELTGLAAGAGLLILGAGTVLVTRRRTKNKGIGEA